MNDAQVQDQTGETSAATVASGAGTVIKAVEMKFKAPMKKAIEAAQKANLPVPTQRPAFTVNLPQYTWQGLEAQFAADSKVRDLVLYLVNEQIVTVARAQVVSDDNPVNSDAELDKSKLELSSIATLTAEQLAGKLEITKEELAALADALEEYLPALGVKIEIAKLMGGAIKTKLVSWKQKPETLGRIREILFQFAESTSAEVVAPLADALEYTNNLIERYMNKPDTDKLSDLLLG